MGLLAHVGFLRCLLHAHHITVRLFMCDSLLLREEEKIKHLREGSAELKKKTKVLYLFMSFCRIVEQYFHMCDRMVIYFFIAASYAPWWVLQV